MIERGQAENLPPVPPADKQAQRGRHFAVVEQILIRNTEKSFALEIQRLQESLRKTRSQRSGNSGVTSCDSVATSRSSDCVNTGIVVAFQ